MRDLYKYSSTKAWKEYYAEKAKGFPYSGSAAMKLNDGCIGRPRESKLDEPGACFVPYWLALELIHEGKGDSLNMAVEDILAKCKKNYKTEVEREKQWTPRPETYGGYPLNWVLFRPLDQDYNDYDRVTLKTEIPIRISKEEANELEKALFEPFYNPYDDGRDCSGVWFSTSVRAYRCANKTIIFHTKHCDC